MKSLVDLLNSIGITRYPDEWNTLYPEFMKEYKAEGAFFLDPSYIIKTENKIHCLCSCLQTALDASKEIRKKPDLVAYSYVLYAAMKNRELFNSYRGKVMMPQTDDPNLSFAFEMLGVFPLIPHCVTGYEKLRAKGLPENVIRASVRNLEEEILVFEKNNGRKGINNVLFNWQQHYIDADIKRECTFFSTRVSLNINPSENNLKSTLWIFFVIFFVTFARFFQKTPILF